MDVDFVADEMQSIVEVNTDQSETVGIPNMVARFLNWTCTEVDKYVKKKKKEFLGKDFGHKFDICDSLWLKIDLKPNSSITAVFREELPI